MLDRLDNPFPAKAVTTYGSSAQEFAEFSYMRSLRDELITYLRAYPAPAPALALCGGHGTGKTSLLTWLSRTASEFQSVPVRSIYAKTDTPNMVETYRTLLQNFTRRDLLDLVAEALVRQGQRRMQMAAATVGEGDRIEETRSLETAFEGRLLDPNELHLELRNALEKGSLSSAVSSRVAFAIGLLEDPAYGDAAFEWLSGAPAELPGELFKTSLFGASEDAAQVAIDALETLATLFREANVPLIVLLDQVENFMPPDNTATSSSIVKKLAEQLGGKSAMLVLAGTSRAWEELPRDVWPRFKGRATIGVGNLSIAETDLLLSVYLDGKAHIASDVVAAINDISGGNTREILQIGYHAWELKQGNTEILTIEDVAIAARAAGTIEDRAQLAQQLFSRCAREMKLSAWRLDYPATDLVVWAVESKTGARVGVVLATATDAAGESRLAQQVSSLAHQLQSNGEAQELIAVTVGYASHAVQALLGGAVRPIVFREESFAVELREQLTGCLAEVPALQTPSDDLNERFRKVEAALAEIQRIREGNEAQTAQLLAQRSAELSSTERQNRKTVTKVELRDGLERLSVALQHGFLGDERQALRELLIDNEAYVQNDGFDVLGSIYLDAVDTEGTLFRAEERETSSQAQALRTLRLELLAKMRQSLGSGRRDASTLLHRIAALAVGVTTLPFFYVMLWGVLPRETYYGDGIRSSGVSQFQLLILSGILSLFAAGAALLIFDFMRKPEVRYSRYRTRVSRIRDEAARRA
ncbi:MAG TPA: hypothetical protein VGC56_18490 [Allosphingosinicella sp.]|jgi:hypothetical protein